MTKHDHSLSIPKHQTRLDTLAAVQRSRVLWDRQHNRLACDWMELTGENDPTLKMLLGAGALTPGIASYVGVNGPPHDLPPVEAEALTRGILDRNRALFEGSPARWEYGRLEHLLQSPERFSRVGVLVADGFYALGSPEIALLHQPVFEFARRQAKALGQFMLVLNVLWRGGTSQKAAEGFLLWKAALSRVAGLPEGTLIPDAYFHHYRGTDRHWTMVLCRLLLDG